MFRSYFYILLARAVSTLAVVTPFSTTGFLDSVTLGGTSPRSGGTVTCNGFTIIIPDNLLVEFPANMVSFKQFSAGDGLSGPQEISIDGNNVDGKIIAGKMSIAQLALQRSNGVIESLGFDGAIKIVNGPVIRINDPNAKYSAGFTTIPFYTADDQNPSVSSFGGFPMCVPRSLSDVDCPSSNRPTNVPNPLNYQVPDSSVMAPLKVNDFIEYSGIKVGAEIICYAINVNIGIYTQPGAVPGFIKVEVANIGVSANNPDLEVARANFVGYVTDPSAAVKIYAIDQDPCTGDETDRLIGSATPGALVGGRAKWQFKTANPVGTITRNYRIKLDSGTKLLSNGILAGQFVQPVTDLIFPEVITPGAVAPENDFTNIGPLANGFGPDADGNVFHQLSPWPGAAAPTPSKVCPDTVTPPTVPAGSTLVVDAGANQIVRGLTIVTLTATQTNTAFDPKNLKFSWTQLDVTDVTPSTGTSATFSFTIPITNLVKRTFQVTVTDITATTSPAIATVTVTTDNTKIDHPIIDTFTWTSKGGNVVNVVAHTELVDPAATMQLKFNNGVTQTMTRSGTGRWTFNAAKTAQPNSVIVTSLLTNVTPNKVLGTATQNGLTAKKRRGMEFSG